ncbi:MAG: phosphoribosylaminoimidazolesuccinocarboxamide synthase [Phycisphaerales bacterium JB037]
MNHPAPEPLTRTDLSLPGFRRGKVRDVYDLPGDPPRTLIVATDRLSAFDVVLPDPIPGKGIVLTRLSAWWFGWLEARGLGPTHLLSTDPADLPEHAAAGATTLADLEGRVTIGRACRVIPIECVVRGYLEGSGWKDYQETGAVCGIDLPAGLRRCDRLEHPVFTPATKAAHGSHDENISFRDGCELVGREVMEKLRDRSIAIYAAARDHAAERGIIIADTKFEFGFPLDAAGKPIVGEPMLIDEVLTPDSSRFWPADEYEPGRAQRSFDKQVVRDYLQGLVDRGEWDKTDPGPRLPPDIIARTMERYAEAVSRLTA